MIDGLNDEKDDEETRAFGLIERGVELTHDWVHKGSSQDDPKDFRQDSPNDL